MPSQGSVCPSEFQKGSGKSGRSTKRSPKPKSKLKIQNSNKYKDIPSTKGQQEEWESPEDMEEYREEDAVLFKFFTKLARLVHTIDNPDLVNQE